MRARYILPRDRYTPCTRMQGGGVPAYVLDYTANTMLQEPPWSGTCCSYSQRECGKRWLWQGKGEGREKGKGAKDSREKRRGRLRFEQSRNYDSLFFGGGGGGGLWNMVKGFRSI